MWQAIAIGTLLAIGGLTTAIIFLVRALRTAQADAGEGFRKAIDTERVAAQKTVALSLDLATAKANAADLQHALDATKSTLDLERAARRAVEKQRDALITDLAAHGDPRGTTRAINRELELLQDLSTPTSTPGAAGSSRGASSPVHVADDNTAPLGRPSGTR